MKQVAIFQGMSDEHKGKKASQYAHPYPILSEKVNDFLDGLDEDDLSFKVCDIKVTSLAYGDAESFDSIMAAMIIYEVYDDED